ncbi:MAG: hypothetical protein AAFV93_07845 [Chloroflexota bacterium]
MGKNTIQLPPALLEDEAQFREWVAKSLAYAKSRPVKKKKKK